MPSNRLILCHPLLLLPSIFPSIRVFSKESVLCIRWPKYWSFHFSISPSNEYSGLISFRMDWLVLLAVQGTLKSPRDSAAPQFKSINFSALCLPYGSTFTSVHSRLQGNKQRRVQGQLSWVACLLPNLKPYIDAMYGRRGGTGRG